MSKKRPRDLILIGRVIRPYGLTGLLRIVSYAESEETFLEAGSVFMNKGQNRLSEREVVSIRRHQSCFLLRLSGLDSIAQAQIFKGAEIFIRKDTLVKTDKDEFFWFELLGLEVYLVTGEYLGVLREILPTGSNDVYVVRNQGREFLIPAIHQVVKEVNVPQKRMVISPIKGLLDLQ